MTINTISCQLLLKGLILSLFISGIALSSNAEIKTDRSFGNASTIDPIDNVYIIDANAGKQIESNLFHSFETFSVENGMTASFTGPPAIKNIISRVTGKEASSIDGTIQSSINGAHFFLLNPNGIIFGSSAQLDIQGSFYASTADFLQMGANERFLSGAIDTGGLVTATPQSFGFLDETIAPIEINGSGQSSNGFGVNIDQHFCIVGGKITIDEGAVLSIKDPLEPPTKTKHIEDSSLKASIQIVSVKSASTVSLQDNLLDSSDVTSFDDIFISNNAKLDVGGSSTGAIRLVGQHITLDHSSCSIENMSDENGKFIEMIGENISVLNEGTIISKTHTDANAASIILSARKDVIISDFHSAIESTSGDMKVNELITGNTANISINAQHISIHNGAEILNRTFSLGDCGNITLNATETISLASKKSKINSSRIVLDTYRKDAESGNSGDMTLTAKNIYLSEGARLSASTRGSGQSGNIAIEALEDFHMYGYYEYYNHDPARGCRIFVRTYGSLSNAGDSGSVSIKAKNIVMEDGASIKAETSSSGNGGNVELTAQENILIQGNIPEEASIIDMSCLAKRENVGTGNAGDLRMTAKNITIKDGAWLNTQTDSKGNAGNIWITAYKRLEVSGEANNLAESYDKKESTNSAIMSSTTQESSGNGGDIDIQAGQIILSQGAYIQSSTHSTGNAGTINIHDFSVITLMGTGSDHKSSQIESNTYAATDFTDTKTGMGGKVTIIGNHLNLFDGARISTSSIALNKATGIAGDIEIKLSGTIQMSGQNLNASDYLGQGSGIYARSFQENQGNSGTAGKISLHADTLFMNDNALVSTSTNGLNDAGDIDIHTQHSIHLTHSSILSESMMSLHNNQNGGSAGTIKIVVGKDIQLFKSSSISTDALSSGGGKIYIHAGNALTLIESKFTTNVHKGEGNGGDINIRAELILMNHSLISANADAGDGGAIFIHTRNLIQSTDSLIEATSERGNDGTVEIQTPDIDISDNLLNLSGNFLNTVNVVKTLCDSVNAKESIHLVMNRPYAVPDSSTEWYNFSASDKVSLLTKAHLDKLDQYNHLSKSFSEDILYQITSNELDRQYK
jgi:filamentous hemagglutinin family protein